MHGMHCRETETGSPQCTGSPPSRKIEKFGLGWFNSPLALRAFSSDFRRARARKQWFFRRCMQNGPTDQADLADFIARGNKPDLTSERALL